MKDITTLDKRANVGNWLNLHGMTGAGVEIGVQNGINAEQILSQWKGCLHLVDPWAKQDPADYKDGTNDIDFQAAYKEAARRMVKFNDRCIFHRALSDEAFERYQEDWQRFDFIYLDGNHSSPQVNRDLENWWELLTPGGLFGGHDYLNLDADCWRCDVKDAVDAFAAKHGLPLHITHDESTAEVGGWPSWWIVKPE